MADLRPSLREIVDDIASHLPNGPWTVKQPHDGDHYFTLSRADGLTLGAFGQTGRHGRTGDAPERLEVRYSIPTRHNGGYCNLRDWGLGTYSEPLATPAATMATSKSPEALAREIARRVLTPSEPIHAQIKARQAQDADNANALVAAAEALRAAVPLLRVEVSDDKTSGSFHYYADGLSFNGRLSGSGTVYLDRVSSFPSERLAAVLAAIKGE
jgi:hypothetical protein